MVDVIVIHIFRSISAKGIVVDHLFRDLLHLMVFRQVGRRGILFPIRITFLLRAVDIPVFIHNILRFQDSLT